MCEKDEELRRELDKVARDIAELIRWETEISGDEAMFPVEENDNAG